MAGVLIGGAHDEPDEQHDDARSNDHGGGGSQGNGYVIMTYDNPFMQPYYDRIKLLVAPYKQLGAWRRDLVRQ